MKRNQFKDLELIIKKEDDIKRKLKYRKKVGGGLLTGGKTTGKGELTKILELKINK